MEPFYRQSMKAFIRTFFRVKSSGFENIPRRGPALIIANHVSYLDGPLIQSVCKRQVRFLIYKDIYDLPVVNYFMRHNRGIPISPKKDSVSHALDEVSKGLEAGDVICIFPEGRLTYTGHLGRFKPGIEWIIERDPVPIFPVAIEGLWGNIFSRKYLHSKWRWIPKAIRPKVTIVCGDVIHPKHVRVNYLQRVIMELLERISHHK